MLKPPLRHFITIFKSQLPFKQLSTKILKKINLWQARNVKIRDNISLNTPYRESLPGNCGLACVAMIVPDVKIETLVKRYKQPPYYLHPIGWTHKGLVEILADLNTHYQSKKYQTINQLIAYLSRGKPIIVSLRIPEANNVSNTKIYQAIDSSQKKTGHLCILTGVNNQGMILNDPRNLLIYSQHTITPLSVFAQIFTGNCIIPK